MRSSITLSLLLVSIISYSQSNNFKAQIFIEDSILVAGRAIIFPLTKDTVKIAYTDTPTIDLNNSNQRVFYFMWSGWKSKIFRFDINSTSAQVQKVMVPDTLFYRQFEEKHTCPICLTTKSVVPIMYGLPSKEMFGQSKNGQLILGGCVTYDYSPNYYCKSDDFKF